MKQLWLLIGFVFLLVVCPDSVYPASVSPKKELNEDIKQIKQLIVETKGNLSKYEGGYLRVMTLTRLEIHKTTLALLIQRQKFKKHGIKPVYKVKTKYILDIPPNEEKVILLMKEMLNIQQEIKTSEEEANRYSGGILRALSLSQAATHKMTRALTLQRLIIAKYGIPYPYLRPYEKSGQRSVTRKEEKAGLDEIIAPERKRRSRKQRRIVRPKSLISIRFVSKSFHKADYSAGDSGDRLEFTFEFKNHLKKNIRAFTGTVVFSDLFDRETLRVSLTESDGLEAGKKKTWNGSIEYNQFNSPHRNLRATKISNLRIRFDLKEVIYTDGGRESFNAAK